MPANVSDCYDAAGDKWFVGMLWSNETCDVKAWSLYRSGRQMEQGVDLVRR